MTYYRLWVFTLFFCTHAISAGVLDGEMEQGYDVPYLHNSHAGYTNTHWMKNIGDHVYISEMSIPGTHNSLSLYGGNIPQTQTLSIPSQLNMGIRFFDVRLKFSNGLLQAYHGPIIQHQTFEEFLTSVSVFLSDNKSEVVLIRMQNEAGAAVHQAQFEERFKTVVDQFDYNYYIPSRNDFKLGEARGKFVFIRDFNVTTRIGIERGGLFIQDFYHFSTNWDLYPKWQKVLNHFSKLQHNSSISLNYLSGSVGSFPYFVVSGKSSSGTFAPLLLTGAVSMSRKKWPDFPRTACLGALCSIQFLGTNSLTSKWISAQPSETKLGIVVTDFPGGQLVNNIIQKNEKFILALASEKQRVFDTWKESLKGKVGDYYFYSNPYQNKTDIFKLKTPSYGYHPTNGGSNSWWEYVGPRKWSESENGKAGEIYEYKNNYTNELEYFKLKKDGRYGYFPINKSDNHDWLYMEAPRRWMENDHSAKAGRYYLYENTYNKDREMFKLKNDGEYGYFPVDKRSNGDWIFISTIND